MRLFSRIFCTCMPRVAQTSGCDVCDMLMPLEGEIESFHAPSAAFLRPQSSSLRDDQHPAGRDRARLFDSERLKRKFVTTLADLRSRRAGWAPASSDTFSSRRAGLPPIALPLGRRRPHPDCAAVGGAHGQVHRFRSCESSVFALDTSLGM